MAWEACVKSITCIKEEKANMPSQLHHVDKGLKEGMMFPRTLFGAFLPNVIKLQMSSHSALKKIFIENVQAMCTGISCSLCDKVHSFWMEKNCNVRREDYMDARE